MYIFNLAFRNCLCFLGCPTLYQLNNVLIYLTIIKYLTCLLVGCFWSQPTAEFLLTDIWFLIPLPSLDVNLIYMPVSELSIISSTATILEVTANLPPFDKTCILHLVLNVCSWACLHLSWVLLTTCYPKVLSVFLCMSIVLWVYIVLNDIHLLVYVLSIVTFT